MPAGEWAVQFFVRGRGYATVETSNPVPIISVNLTLEGMLPAAGSVFGGTLLRISGLGFDAYTATLNRQESRSFSLLKLSDFRYFLNYCSITLAARGLLPIPKIDASYRVTVCNVECSVLAADFDALLCTTGASALQADAVCDVTVFVGNITVHPSCPTSWHASVS